MSGQRGLIWSGSLDSLPVSTVLIPVLILCYLSYVRCATPLRRVPGPFLASFSRLWKLQKTLRGDFERTNIDLHRKYGECQPEPVYRRGTAYSTHRAHGQNCTK